MKYLKILIVTLIILSPFKVKGIVCKNSVKSYLKSLAQNVTYNYTYTETNGNVTFNIYFYNITPDLYLVDSQTGQKFNYSNDVLELNNFKPGTSYKFDVRSTDIICDIYPLYSLYINTPYYNRFYNDPICDGLNYKYCNKWQKITFSYEEFIKDVENYRKSIEKENNNIVSIKGLFDYILEFYLKYYYYILPSLIVLLTTYIVIYRKKNSFF